MIRSTRAALAAAALTALALASCSSVDVGTVASKDHRGGYFTTVPITMPGPNNTVRTTYTQQYHPECWELVVTDGTDASAHCVREEVWLAHDVGDDVDLS